MGLFDILKGKKPEQLDEITFPAVLGSPCKGEFVPMEHIPDEMFSTGVLGVCCGIEPAEGKVYAPIGGKISQMAETIHAVGIEAGEMEVLIHVGVDTVEMGGDGFRANVKEGQIIKKGGLLLTMDVEKIKAAGHPAVVIMAVTNSDDVGTVEAMCAGAVEPGNDVLKVSK